MNPIPNLGEHSMALQPLLVSSLQARLEYHDILEHAPCHNQYVICEAVICVVT